MENNEEESEEDYLSDKFLEIAKTHDESSRKRKLENLPPKIETPQEKLEKALNTKISTENKGYKLLKKLGFEEGKGLGKNKQGIQNPIPISTQQGKTGLGIEGDKRRIKTLKERKENNEFQQMSNAFKSNVQKKYMEKRISSDTNKAFKILVQLELGAGLTSAESKYIKLSEEKEQQLNRETKLEIILEEDEQTFEEKFNYLKELFFILEEKYLYCIYCGITFRDQGDLEENCPGLKDHLNDDF